MSAAIEQGNYDQEILLDSGAFTAWSKGDAVKLSSLVKIYRTFIKKYESKTKAIWLINLDRIPGEKNRDPTAQEITDAIKESDTNFSILTHEFGTRILPVFHQGESQLRLNEIVQQAPYICVSPRNDLPEHLRVKWSRAVHDKLPADIRTHGLATTGIEMSTTVPWHSTDSATWVHAALFGEIFLNVGQGGAPKRIAISSQHPGRFTRGRHYDSTNLRQQAWIKQRAEEKGFNIEELRQQMSARAAFSMLEFIDWNYAKNVNVLNTPSLFDL